MRTLFSGQGADIVEIAVAYTYNPEYFNNIKGNPNRGIVVRPITNGTDQITLLGIATAAFDYAVGFRPTTIQVLAIGAGGDNIGGAAGGSGYYGWAQFTTIPDVNETLTINVNVGMTVSGGNGQSTTVSIPSYVPTITATGGGNGNNPYGQNPGSWLGAGAGFGTTSVIPSAYIRPESLQIWRDLAYTQFVALGFGGGGLVCDTNYDSYNIVKQPGVVFLFIRGVVYY